MTKAFIDKVKPIILKYDSPILPSVRVAQAVLESNSGKSELARVAKNLFGIKASYPWTGAKLAIYSREHGQGLVRSDFRKYESWEESVKDHAGFIVSTDFRKEYYKDVIEGKTYEEQARALTGTYATDIDYDKKLIKIIDDYDLYKLDLEQKKGGGNMGVNVKRMIVAPTGNNSFGRGHKMTGITVHQTGNPRAGANALMHARLQRNGFSASWHYTVDDKEIYQSFEDDVACWHAGDGHGNGNKKTIAIETCINQDGNYNGAIENLINLLVHLCKKHNFTTKNIYQHNNWSGKNCPMQIRAGKNGWTWSKILDTVDKRLGQVTDPYNPQGLKTSTIPSHKAPKKPFKELEEGDKVTIRSPHNWWYNPSRPNEGIIPSQDFSGRVDVITDVVECEVSYSKRAYKLMTLNSWILEQDLIEARIQKAVEVKDDEKPSENYLFLGGKYYKIIE